MTIDEVLIENEALADAIRAELVRQQQYSIGKHGIVALAEAPFISAVYAAIRSALKEAGMVIMPISAVEEAADEWEHNAQYKGKYLLEKHDDVRGVAEFRAMIASSQAEVSK